jgi:hypothetical protein
MGRYYEQSAGKFLTGFCKAHGLQSMGHGVIVKENLCGEDEVKAEVTNKQTNKQQTDHLSRAGNLRLKMAR